MAIIKYKKGDSWVSVPMYVNTGGYITGSQIKKINGQSLVGEGNINITVDLSNYYTKSDVDGLIPSLNNYYNKSETYSQSEVNALINGVNAGNLGNYYTKDEIDSMIPSTEGFITEIPEEYITELELNQKGYLTEHQSLDNYYNKSEIDSKIASAGNFDSTQYYDIKDIDAMLKDYARQDSIPITTSQLTNDSGFITTIPDDYITEKELATKGYLTSADLEEMSSSAVDSFNELISWYVSVDESDARLKIRLDGMSSTYPLDNYSDVLDALVTKNITVHISSESLGMELTIRTNNNLFGRTTGIIHGRVKDSSLDNQWYIVSGEFSAILASDISDDTTIYVPINSYTPVDMQQVTYSQLKTYADNGKLIPGRKYAITDYTCIYRQPVTNIEMEINDTNENIRIICTAVSSNTLSENVEYIRADGYVPIVECKYSIDPESKSWTAGMTSKSPKGVVWYMKDANGNECNYDFKHIKFRRWAITDITANLIEHDGTSNGVSPYRVKATTVSKIISDDRQRVGCGEPADEALIRNIVNGTWLNSTNDLKLYDSNSNALSFHSNYSKYYHKPYTDTSKPRQKYLAWNTTMNEDITVSKYHGGLVLYSINSSSYEDMYTFDCNGDDMSEQYYNDIPKVLKASIVAGVDIANFQKLPNIVIQTSVDSTTISKFEIDMGYNNTILLYTYAGLTNAKLTKVSLHNFYKNLILTYNWNTIIQKRDDMYDNCMVGEIEKCQFATFYKNAIFGYISNIITTGNFFCNLWFNVGYRVNYNNSTSWESPTDSLQSKQNILKGGCYSNILGPMQYCTICPHHNSNTYRSYYYRGNFFNPNIQHNSLGQIRYTKLDYKAIHQAKTGTIEGCNINFEAFVGKNNYIKYINDEQYICGWNDSLRTQLPNMKKLSTSLQSGYYSENDEWHPYTDFTWNISYSGELHSRGILYVDSSKKLQMTTIVNII